MPFIPCLTAKQHHVVYNTSHCVFLKTLSDNQTALLVVVVLIISTFVSQSNKLENCDYGFQRWIIFSSYLPLSAHAKRFQCGHLYLWSIYIFTSVGLYLWLFHWKNFIFSIAATNSLSETIQSWMSIQALGVPPTVYWKKIEIPNITPALCYSQEKNKLRWTTINETLHANIKTYYGSPWQILQYPWGLLCPFLHTLYTEQKELISKNTCQKTWRNALS